MYNILESLQERRFNLSSLIRMMNKDNKENSKREIISITRNMINDLEDLLDEINGGKPKWDLY